MSLEFILEDYPKTVKLLNGTDTEIRPLKREDEILLKDLYMATPEEERMFVKSRLTDGSLFHEWCENIDYDRNLPLLMLQDGKVIGEATLHQRTGGWKRHIGLVSVLTHPGSRNIGVARKLLEEIISIAQHCGLQKLEAELNGEREVAIKAFGLMGFDVLARIPNYVQDMQAGYHDYVLMGMSLLTKEEYAGVGG